MTCRFRADCAEEAVAIVDGRIVCRHHAGFLIDLARLASEDWAALPLRKDKL